MSPHFFQAQYTIIYSSYLALKTSHPTFHSHSGKILIERLPCAIGGNMSVNKQIFPALKELSLVEDLGET